MNTLRRLLFCVGKVPVGIYEPLASTVEHVQPETSASNETLAHTIRSMGNYCIERHEVYDKVCKQLIELLATSRAQFDDVLHLLERDSARFVDESALNHAAFVEDLQWIRHLRTGDRIFLGVWDTLRERPLSEQDGLHMFLHQRDRLVVSHYLNGLQLLGEKMPRDGGLGRSILVHEALDIFVAPFSDVSAQWKLRADVRAHFIEAVRADPGCAGKEAFLTQAEVAERAFHLIECFQALPARVSTWTTLHQIDLIDCYTPHIRDCVNEFNALVARNKHALRTVLKYAFKDRMSATALHADKDASPSVDSVAADFKCLIWLLGRPWIDRSKPDMDDFEGLRKASPELGPLGLGIFADCLAGENAPFGGISKDLGQSAWATPSIQIIALRKPTLQEWKEYAAQTDKSRPYPLMDPASAQALDEAGGVPPAAAHGLKISVELVDKGGHR